MKSVQKNLFSQSSWKDLTDLITNSEQTFDHKVAQISLIMMRFPRRRFILVGDSGEKDPEVYREIQAKFPEQVQEIWIRDIVNDRERNMTDLPGCASFRPRPCNAVRLSLRSNSDSSSFAFATTKYARKIIHRNFSPRSTQRGLRPQCKVGITLRRDEHLSIDIHQPWQLQVPGTGCRCLPDRRAQNSSSRIPNRQATSNESQVRCIRQTELCLTDHHRCPNALSRFLLATQSPRL